MGSLVIATFVYVGILTFIIMITTLSERLKAKKTSLIVGSLVFMSS